MTGTESGALIVAIDGPSGTGKSSVSRRLARHLGAAYLDTGAMYRIATLYVLRRGVDPADPAAIAATVADLPWSIGTDPGIEDIRLDGQDVRDEIRGDEVTAAVSAVSAVPEVREPARRGCSATRPRGTRASSSKAVTSAPSVLPEADVKIFLTASAESTRTATQRTRTSRKDCGDDYDAVLADVQRRDHLDSTRAVSPLRAADDAVVVDTSDMNIDEVTAALTAVVTEQTGAAL